MSSTIASGRAGIAPISYGYHPQEGSRSVSLQFDWRTRTSYTDDLSQLVAMGIESTVQTIVVDNTDNPQSVTFTFFDTGQTIVCPGNSLGYFPIFVTAGGLFTAAVPFLAVATTRVEFLNVALSPSVSGLQPALNLNFLTGVLDGRITYTGGNGSFFDSAGALTAATTNVARFDYDPVALLPRGLLLEESRTNLLLNSAVLSTQAVTTAALPTTLSFYGTGTVTLSGTSTAGPLVGTGPFPARVSLTFTPTAGALTATVTGSVLDAQIETGPTATSYIPTTGATVTRTADNASMPWPVSYPFTLVGEAMVPALQPVNSEGLAVLTDGTVANRVFIRATGNTALGSMGAGFVVGGVTTAMASTVNTLTIGAPFSVRVAATALAGLTVTGNGGAPVTAAGAGPVGLNLLTFGQTNTPGNALNGWLRRIQFYNP